MQILVINCGSSSLKYRVLDMDAERTIAAGLVERIGERDAAGAAGPTDHRSALLEAIGRLPDPAAIDAVGHRVVHGGTRFLQPQSMDAAALAELANLDALAPLHNPANRLGMELCRELLPGRPHVAVFDTAFHHTLPAFAHRYAVPADWHARGVRRYGFHGTSHRHVSREAARLLGQDPAATNLISLHLGNGASITAIANGRSVDTSMGMTPLEGLVMGTRSGDLDPGALLFMLRQGCDAAALDAALNRCAGLHGLCGANDMRAVHALADGGDAAAELALEVFCYRARKYVGAYCAALGRVDALVFTAGIGEHDAAVRARILAGLDWFGIRLDAGRNAACSGGPAAIHAPDSRSAVFVIPADEELAIAREVAGLIGG
jgi:acetate kinase